VRANTATLCRDRDKKYDKTFNGFDAHHERDDGTNCNQNCVVTASCSNELFWDLLHLWLSRNRITVDRIDGNHVCAMFFRRYTCDRCDDEIMVDMIGVSANAVDRLLVDDGTAA